MEAPEVPLERTQEDMHHHAEASRERWVMGVALTAAVLAVLAAISSLLAEHHANEAMIEQIRASDQWNYYQAKSIKANLLASKIVLLEALGKKIDEQDVKKAERYEDEQKEIQEKAEEMEKVSKSHLDMHTVFARGVTMFQVAIAIGAISVLTKRRQFWYASIAFGAAGLLFLVLGFFAG
jgi:sensor domain CHASE-containing protein